MGDSVKVDVSSMNIYQKITSARSAVGIKKQPVKMKNRNSGKLEVRYFAYKLEDVYKAVKDVCDTFNLSTFTTMKPDENDCTKFLITLKVVNNDNPQESEIFQVTVGKANILNADDAQNCGGSHTYGVRYAYTAFLLLDDEELDPDHNTERQESKDKAVKRAEPKKYESSEKEKGAIKIELVKKVQQITGLSNEATVEAVKDQAAGFEYSLDNTEDLRKLLDNAEDIFKGYVK